MRDGSDPPYPFGDGESPDTRQLDMFAEAFKRDEAMRKLETHRADLIGIAFDIAKGIALSRGEVTSTEVLAVMREREDLKEELAGKDPRFMGPVFRRKCWRRTGWKPAGSHCRPVAIWRYEGDR